MKTLKMFDGSRYNHVPKIMDEDEGMMVLPFCPEFQLLHTYTAKSTDTISGLAEKFYGDSRLQWAIIIANELPFPPTLSVGVQLYIPDPDEVLSLIMGV